MKEDWTDRIRQELERFEMTPPEGLWEDICKQMDMPAEPVSASHKRWYWAVAAAVLALVGFFAVYLYEDHSEPSVLTAKSEMKPIESKENTEIESKTEPKTEPKAEAPQKAKSSIKATPSTTLITFSTQKDEEAKAEITIEPEEPTETEVLAESGVQSEPEIQSDSVASVEEEKPQTSKPTKKAIDFPELMPEPQVRANNPHEWAVGVNASGGVLTGKTAHEDRTATNIDIEEQKDEKSKARNAINDFYPHGDSDWNHHIPIRLGLSVQYQLNDHLALTSGISYTYLYSEWGKAFLKGGGYEQMLHYIGVPLGVAWKLWSSKHFHFYLSGTVLLEKCISFKYRWQESQTVNSVRPWQFSIRTAVGAEYAFTPQFGIYFEPSLGYYFNDGSSLRHYYKERPFAPSLDFGLRLHLK